MKYTVVFSLNEKYCKGMSGMMMMQRRNTDYNHLDLFVKLKSVVKLAKEEVESQLRLSKIDSIRYEVELPIVNKKEYLNSFHKLSEFMVNNASPLELVENTRDDIMEMANRSFSPEVDLMTMYKGVLSYITINETSGEMYQTQNLNIPWFVEDDTVSSSLKSQDVVLNKGDSISYAVEIEGEYLIIKNVVLI